MCGTCVLSGPAGATVPRASSAVPTCLSKSSFVLNRTNRLFVPSRAAGQMNRFVRLLIAAISRKRSLARLANLVGTALVFGFLRGLFWYCQGQRVAHDAKPRRQAPRGLAVHLDPNRFGVDRLATHLRCPQKTDIASLPKPSGQEEGHVG